MSLAIRQAQKGAGFVAPNPLVGCVILDQEQRLLSLGYHRRWGGDHAEVEALKKIPTQDRRRALQGAQVFVTLEPCAHQGLTPSCAHELIRWPLAKVIYGLKDPNPKVSGKGAEIIRQKGISCEQADFLQGELEDLAEVFLTNMREQRSFIALKVASSLDGKLAMANGESQWITNESSRHHVQYLRGIYQAVLIGRQTLLKDQPRLNSRHPRFQDRQNTVIVLDPKGQSLDGLAHSSLAQVRPLDKIVLVLSERRKKALGPRGRIGFELLFCPELESGQLDLLWLSRELYRQGIASILVEGGAHTHSQFLQQGPADRLYQFLGPVLMGGPQAIGWTEGLQIQSFQERLVLRRMKAFKLEDNILVTGCLGR